MASASMRWPRQDYDSMVKFYGPVGKNTVLLQVPKDYPLVLAWDTKQKMSRFSVHEKIHDATKRVLERALDHYGPEGLKAIGAHLFGGSLNVRKMRGGTAWSIHSWAAAIDWDPGNNQLRWTKAKARLAKPDAAMFLDLWAGEGFVSLGRARDFDWMHIQAARL